MNEHKPKYTAEELIRFYFLHKEQFSEELIGKFQGWLALNEGERETTETLEELFDQMVACHKHPSQRAYRMNAAWRERNNIQPNPATIHKPGYRRLAFRAAAVVIPLLVLGGTLLMRYGTGIFDKADTPFVAVATITVPAHDHKFMELPDGSRVWLQESTELSYGADFNENREVHLKGEAYFSVVHTLSDAPFRVVTELASVQVLGTEFNVKAYPDDATAEVTLARGSVEVTAKATGQMLKLEPNVQAVVDKATAAMYTKTVAPDQIGKDLDGKAFTDATVVDVLHYIGRQYKVVVVVEQGVPESRNIRIRFRGNESLDDALFVLRQLSGDGFDYHMSGDTVRITRPGGN